jgi:radical SAM protein (TIGR04043 family)
MQLTTPKPLPTAQLINELQSCGVRLVDPKAGNESRRGGAGPSDHKALTIDGMTVMVPVHTAPAFASPYLVEKPDAEGRSTITRDGVSLGSVTFPLRPRFYDRVTTDGVPYWKIAVLHGRDVLATTVLQSCIRYQSRTKTCQFCAIGQSLAAGRTIERKTPGQLAEVAKAAVELDGVKHMVMTTGTPPGRDRGAEILAESASAIKQAIDLPIQGQCEPPDDDAWFARMKNAGIDALGMHLEAVTDEVRARVMPGKAQVPLARYFSAFASAVPVFGRGQVSTYILAGLGDPAEAILSTCEKLIGLGVYPFVVPFVPISGTPLESHPPPSPAFMHGILRPLAGMLNAAQLQATDIKAGCGKCGACSALSTYEREATP